MAHVLTWCFPGDSGSKESACIVGDPGLIPFSPGERNGKLLQNSRLGNPMDRGAWRATVHEGAKSQIRLSDFDLLTYVPAHWIFRNVEPHALIGAQHDWSGRDLRAVDLDLLWVTDPFRNWTETLDSTPRGLMYIHSCFSTNPGIGRPADKVSP